MITEGGVVSVTAIEAGPCVVTQVKTGETDGYQAVQLGFEEARRLNKPEAGHLKKVRAQLRHLREIRRDLGDLQVGSRVDVSIFKPGDRVDVVGVSKGRGFAGVVKRHHFAGGPKTHGQSDRHRGPGSVGSTTYAGRVFKGLRMAGHMGDQRVTVKNLEVVTADLERNLLLVRGGVPGANRALLMIVPSKRSGG